MMTEIHEPMTEGGIQVRCDGDLMSDRSVDEPTGPTLRITRHGRGYRLVSGMWLPRALDEVFAFFADAGNLNVITPPWVAFRVLTPLPVVMRPGLLLDYRLKLRGVPIHWQSEITAWDPPHRFVDEQRKGPYLRWVHEHGFREKRGGTEVIDQVDYAVLGGPLVHRLFVERDLQSIFTYRARRLAEILGPSNRPVNGPVS